jgi:hypothetical protein
MRRMTRIAWILLGLLALAGALHAPLHEDGHACAPTGLCSGLLVLGACGVVATWQLICAAIAQLPVLRAAQVRDLRPRLTVRGRAPPRV